MSDDDETTQVVYYSQPEWRWSWWDAAGIALITVGGLFGTVGQGLNLAARECNAMAQWTRNRFDVAEYQAAHEAQQRSMGEELERQVGLDQHWLSDETKPEDIR